MRLLKRLRAYGSLRPRRNTNDLAKYLVRRPQIAAAIGAYETATMFSNRMETRAKYLAGLLTSSLIGCPF